ncbi:MAG TPA: ATP-dependent sacrificial sulfur transferase LarE [Opitutaceae bacterium]|nr:ATP-dependent sacrificial sulfur transferase LarE [Opitutaceae bacterium]
MSSSPSTLDEKYQRLLAILASHGRVAVAFSGGVDSSFLCRAARDAVGDDALAITVTGPMMPSDDLATAREVAALTGIRHVFIDDPELDEPVAANPVNRCYHCKKIEFARIAEVAQQHGIATVLDGSNLDDESDYRPGLTALAELKVVSPLRAAGLRKADIRELSRELGLPTWDKPAAACLGSRVPYGERITLEKLRAIDRAEQTLRAHGFRQCRVRHHGDIARIEVAPAERSRFFDAELLDAVSREIKAAGFRYVCLELEGYQMGSLNRALPAGTAAAQPAPAPHA